MKKIILLIFWCFYSQLWAQTVVSGTIKDASNRAILGANVYLKGTYAGGSSNEEGTFRFTTDQTGTQVLVISFVSCETKEVTMEVTNMQGLRIQLQENIAALATVTLNAGAFKAGDQANISALKPLDIVTTAGALGDFVGALQTLPGTSTIAEDGRLFVRGGRAEETQIFIDGLRVFTPYSNTTNNIPTRGRYSPLLFSGIRFSTGGYAAEYGQALSGVLELNTIREPVQEKTDISIMTLGGGIGHTEKWSKGSLSLNTSYVNLAPYLTIFPDRNNWQSPFQTIQGESVFRHHFENGTFKGYAAFDHTDFELEQAPVFTDHPIAYKFNNYNLYMNGSYKGVLGEDWGLSTGISYTRDRTKQRIIDNKINSLESSFHLKAVLKKRLSHRFKLNFGAEYFGTDFREAFENTLVTPIDYGFHHGIFSGFTDTDVYLSKNIAAKFGLRLEHSLLCDETHLSPRINMAFKTSEKDQFSVAFGQFYQYPRNHFLKYDTQVKAEKATHYILNYQYAH